MKRRFMLIVVVFAFCLLVAPVWADNYFLDVIPMGWDYGNVPVGTFSTASFDLVSLGPTEVWIYTIGLTANATLPMPDAHSDGYTLGAFSFNTYPIVPIALPVGEYISVDVVFTPPSPGYYSVYLGIDSNDSVPPPGALAFLLLEGYGINVTVPEPTTLILLGLGLIGLAGVRRKFQK